MFPRINIVVSRACLSVRVAYVNRTRAPAAHSGSVVERAALSQKHSGLNT